MLLIFGNLAAARAGGSESESIRWRGAMQQDRFGGCGIGAL